MENRVNVCTEWAQVSTFPKTKAMQANAKLAHNQTSPEQNVDDDCADCTRLTGLENENAHSSLWTRSPGLGTRIVDRTDMSISLTSVIFSFTRLPVSGFFWSVITRSWNTVRLKSLTALFFLSVSPQWKGADGPVCFIRGQGRYTHHSCKCITGVRRKQAQTHSRKRLTNTSASC